MSGEGRRSSFHAPRLTFLGTLRGTGPLVVEGGAALGDVEYEIDLYLEREKRIANGRISGGEALIAAALEAKAATLTLVTGAAIAFTLRPDPDDPQTAEIDLTGDVPEIAKG